MRTLELPDEFFERAEAEATRRGVSLQDFIVEAVAPTLEGVSRAKRRVEFPVFMSKNPGTLDLTPEMIRQVEHEDDMRRSGLLD